MFPSAEALAEGARALRREADFSDHLVVLMQQGIDEHEVDLDAPGYEDVRQHMANEKQRATELRGFANELDVGREAHNA